MRRQWRARKYPVKDGMAVSGVLVDLNGFAFYFVWLSNAKRMPGVVGQYLF